MAEMLQRKPLFMGSNTAQMLRLVVQFTGKPSEADLTFVTNKKVRLVDGSRIVHAAGLCPVWTGGLCPVWVGLCIVRAGSKLECLASF